VTPAEEELTRLEHELIRAVQRRDRDLLDGLLGDDFTLTTGRPGAEVRTRAEWLRIAESEYAIEEFAFEELVVQVYGSAAVVRSRYSQRGAMGGERRDTTFRMTDVWVRDGDGWRLRVRHAQPVAGD
jgi:ketosteroid isomerase-like protein